MLTIAITMGQSEPAPMATPVGHFVHRMGWMIHLFFHLSFYRTLTSILPQSIVLAADL